MRFLKFLRKLFGIKTPDEQYEDGFHWGYNEVSSGRLTPLEAERRYESPIGGTTPFDDGARNGVNTAIAVHNIDDDRVYKGE